LKLKFIKGEYNELYKDEQNKLQGEYKYFYDIAHKKLWEHTFYKDDKVHGKYMLYDENGNLSSLTYYKNGTWIPEQEYNEWQLKEKIEKVLVTGKNNESISNW